MAAFRSVTPFVGAALWLFVGLAGCVQMPSLPNPFHQETPEELLEKQLDIGVVGDVTEVNNGGATEVFGVGLVMGLDGTGGSPTGQYRSSLEQQLRKQKIENTKALFDDPNNALVLVKAVLPAGVRKGEKVEVEVALPPESKASSLKGGFLADCPLRPYESAKNINPEKNGSLAGHVLATASGPLIVGLGDPENATALKRGRIWAGAASHVERHYWFVLNKDGQKSAKVSAAIANRLNRQFQDDAPRRKVIEDHRDLFQIDEVTKQINRLEPGSGKGDIARAGEKAITVRVPYAYRYNHERFMLVARLLPLTVPPDVMTLYRTRLDTILLEPKHTLRAALRLEALGKDSVPILTKGLASPHPLVRFCAAESLAYLGSTAGIAELANLAVDHPDLRAYALAAIAGLDESICRQKLGELMTIDDPQLRSGAFRALAMLDDADLRLGGEEVIQTTARVPRTTFYLHKVAPVSVPLVTFATTKRAEVVIFGADPTIKAPLRILAGGDFTVTADPGDDRLTISRFTVRGVAKRSQCSLLLEDALRTMVELGAGYPDIVDLLKNLHDERALSCDIREAALPAAAGLQVILQADLKETRVPTTDAFVP
jgi:hypothetical protein